MKENIEHILTPRPYQNEALFAISNFVKNILRGVEDENIEKLFKNSALLNMATGSGKTFTVGKALENIIKLRNRFNSIKNSEHFENLNIITFTHRIDLIDQFRDDLVVGRDGKKSIISDEIVENFDISTYHSKVEKNTNKKKLKSEKDNIIFTTHQTAGNEKLIDELDYVDIILVDELHNVKKDSDYFKTIQDFAKKGRNGKQAIIIGVTATPNNHTREIFGEEIFDYGLEKYLNSEYSPSVEYNLMTNSKADKQTVEKLQGLIETAKNTQDFSKKKELIKQAEELFIEIMASFNDDEELVDDLIERAGENGKIGETVIFCDSIEKADNLAEIINNKLGETDFALSFHSGNDENKAIDRLRDKNDNCKIILSVGKLNEGIDLPKVENVVFWRGTDSETIFFQQFGRGLRGTELVKYFDYVGGIKNFAWIDRIYQKYIKLSTNEEKEGRGGKTERQNKFNLIRGTMGLNDHNINFSDIGIEIKNIKEEFNISKEEVIDYFKNIKGSEDESYEYWINLNKNNIKNIQYKGFKVNRLATFSGYNSLNNLSEPKGFKDWISFLFNKENITKENIFNHFRIIKKTEEKSYIYLHNLTQEKIKKINYKGYKISKIISLTGYRNGDNNFRNPRLFKKWINWLFNKEKDKITKEEIIVHFKNIKGSEEESYIYLYNLTQKGIKEIEYKGNKITTISKLSGYITTDRIVDSLGFKKWVNWLFNKKEEKKEIITRGEIRDYFKGLKGNENDSYKYLTSLNKSNIGNLEYKGNKIVKIVNLSGWDNPNNVKFTSPGRFKEFINWIFDK